MPHKPARPCRHLGCPALTLDVSGYCDTHKRQQQQLQDARRGTSTQRGYDARWHKARTSYLHEHPLCVKCQAEGRITPATVVDHIKPHRGNYDLMWDTNNWQALCARHHNIKTATEDGAFGNIETR